MLAVNLLTTLSCTGATGCPGKWWSHCPWRC